MRSAAEITASLKRNWYKENGLLTSGFFTVRLVRWTPPGFSPRKKSTGYALFHGEKQMGPAFNRAVDAQAHCEQYSTSEFTDQPKPRNQDNDGVSGTAR